MALGAVEPVAHHEDASDLAHILRAKDESAQNAWRMLEQERDLRARERSDAVAEAAALQSRCERQRQELECRLQAQATEFQRDCEQRADEHSRLRAHLEAQRGREAELVQRNEALAADLQRLLLRADDDGQEIAGLRAQLAEVRALLQTSDSVREGLLAEARGGADALARARAELQESRLLEVSVREHGEAQHTRLQAECQALARQAQDASREADVARERVGRHEQQLRSKELELERVRTDGEARRRELEQKLDDSAKEAAKLREQACGLEAAKAAAAEKATGLEAQLQAARSEEQKLLQELSQLRGSLSERGAALESATRREQSLTGEVGSLDGRLRPALAEGLQLRRDLEASRAEAEALREQCTDLRARLARAEDAGVEGTRSAKAHVEDLVRRHQERVASLEAEVLQASLQMRRAVEEREEATVRYKGQAEESAARLEDTMAKLEETRTRLEDTRALLGSQLAEAKAETAGLLARQEELRAQLERERVRVVEVEKEVQCLRTQRVMRPPRPDGVRGAVLAYANSRLSDRLRRRALLCDAFQLWTLYAHAEGLRARLEAAAADETPLTECATDISPEGIPESTVAGLKRLLLEFRRRAAASVAEMAPAGALEVEAQPLLTATLGGSRRRFGRLLYVALFLYQKLRTVVPSELQETLRKRGARRRVRDEGEGPPLPFYVLPYKGAAPRRRWPPANPPPPPGVSDEAANAWLQRCVAELEDALPISSGSAVAAPQFLARLLRARAAAAAVASGVATAVEGGVRPAGARLRAELLDRLDVLLVDALTIYMSAWRLLPYPSSLEPALPGEGAGGRRPSAAPKGRAAQRRARHGHGSAGAPCRAATRGAAWVTGGMPSMEPSAERLRLGVR